MGKSKAKEMSNAWTAGRMHGITHIELIARGGFGEVHKVFPIPCHPLISRCIIKEVIKYRFLSYRKLTLVDVCQKVDPYFRRCNA